MCYALWNMLPFFLMAKIYIKRKIHRGITWGLMNVVIRYYLNTSTIIHITRLHGRFEKITIKKFNASLYSVHLEIEI